LIATTASAQIPNAGFENWTGADPTSWATSNAAPVYVNVTKSTTAHGGTASAQVTLSVYNLLGQEVAVLVNELKGPGTYEATFDAANHPSGMYLFRLRAGNNVLTRAMILVR
jgi:hypothetical protein